MKIKLFLVYLSFVLIVCLTCKKQESPDEPPVDIATTQTPTGNTRQVQPMPQPPVEPPLIMTNMTPTLRAAILIKDGDNPLSIGHTTSPEVIDWNNDGKKDLLVGTFSEGKIKLFLNQGTDADPIFAGGEFLQAGGEELHAGSG